jgi:hypothetical protein
LQDTHNVTKESSLLRQLTERVGDGALVAKMLELLMLTFAAKP